MRRLVILAALLVSVLVPAAALGSSTSSASSGSAPVSSAPQLLAFRGHFGGFHLGGGGFGRRGSSHVLRRVAHALVFAYILHLFFSHGGLSILIWLLVIGLVVHFVRRGRRRRARYA